LWWKNPKYVLPVLWGASGVVAGVIWLVQTRNPDLDLSFPYTIALAAFTAMLGAGMAMWVYSHITQEGQRREWGHEREVRHFEEIYGPLYEDVRRVAAELKDHGAPWLQNWRDIKEKKMRPFVQKDIKERLNTLERRLSDLSEVARQSYDAAKTRIEEAFNRYPVSATGNFLELLNALTQDRRFLFDPKAEMPRDEYLASIREILRSASNIETDEDIAKYLRHIKDYLRKDMVIQKRAALTESILPDAEALHRQICRRMTHPYE
jgi:hypothetical protein